MRIPPVLPFHASPFAGCTQGGEDQVQPFPWLHAATFRALAGRGLHLDAAGHQWLRVIQVQGKVGLAYEKFPGTGG